MFVRNIAIILIGLILSSCSDGFLGYFKKSANKKLVDTQGFQGGKRPPLYNKKYIELAKRNIVDNNLEEEDIAAYEDEEENLTLDASTKNRLMYMKMLRTEDARNSQGRYEARRDLFSYPANIKEDDTYPSLAEISRKTEKRNEEYHKLSQELSQIRAMLKEAKNDLADNKCVIDQAKTTSKKKNLKSDSSMDQLTIPNTAEAFLEGLDEDSSNIQEFEEVALGQVKIFDSERNEGISNRAYQNNNYQGRFSPHENTIKNGIPDFVERPVEAEAPDAI